MTSSPREQEGIDEQPAEGAPADHSGVQESKTSLPKESPTAEEQEEEVEKKISETFFYNYENIYSQPFVTEDSGIPINLLTLKHSFGYDCTRSVNLLPMDSQTLLYIAGNQVVLLDLKTKSQSYLRSSSGGGIGFIVAHPTKQYFAVGEKGKKPNIIIYDYPSLRPYRILQGGTEEAYVFGDFNHAGTLLASVGGSPDYMLTIWDWKQEKIVLRSKAFSQDVYKVTFSADNEEQLTTSGTGHIRFWKMALTFTGLKLQGALGRFGKTAVTDIIGYVELPDGKVISGTEWGNLLLWEGGLIKVELCRAGHKPCHSGPVSQLVLDEGELVTVGKDGFIRVWNFETIDAADSVDDTGLLEVEPMNELHVGRNVSLNFMSKVHDCGQPVWYAQDTNGAIWKLDLTFSNMSRDPECLYTFHSGRIEAMSVSPITYLLATTALDRVKERMFRCSRKMLYVTQAKWVATLWFYLCDHREDMRRWDGTSTSTLEAQGRRTSGANHYHNDALVAISHQPRLPDPIHKLIHQLESQEVISKTCSPFKSPIRPVQKSNEEWRLTVDYRGLNEVTSPLSAAVPDILELQYELESKAAKWYATTDIANAFFSIPLAAECRPQFAFTWRGVQYAWNQLPRGWKHSPTICHDRSRLHWNRVKLWNTCNTLMTSSCGTTEQRGF
ncbi:cilia- and flagella-associated protein 44-like [Egretta garzetta]|uniref:cilia- and flagella-associated protein 44-like n=1 Tax=Egretta garzetta TaxID=188379 RepID=UPI00051F1190|nr:cilia- and flagella-associated protein 44-like [Egretta garzetta]